jgi:glycosyltransferase involved in cell wall biosynthesis
MTTPTSKSRPIRVAHVIQNLNYGGMERVLHSLASQLPAHGFEVHVVVLQYFGRFAEGLEGTVSLHQVPPMSRLSLLYPRQLAEVLRTIAPDIVHSHTGVWLKSARASMMAGVKAMVHTEHGRPDPVPFADRLIDNYASRHTDAIVAVSGALEGVLRTQVVHDPTRIRVIANGVDTERIRPSRDRAALRRDLGIPEAAPVIGSIGRLEPIKNFHLALRALARLDDHAGDEPAPLLVIVGDGTERGSLEALASELGITQRVKFLGWRADAERIYGAFDLFTLTSRSEGTSISLLEAMSSGVCPIVTDVGGNRAVLGPDLASLMVADGDTAALTTAWRLHLNDRMLREERGRQARVRVEEAFSVHQMIEGHIKLYRELVEGAGLHTLSRLRGMQ